MKTKTNNTTISEEKNSTLSENDGVKNPENQVKSSNSYESSVENSFFYTNDKFINSLDNIEIFQYIQKQFPDFYTNNADIVIKKTIVEILENHEFMGSFLTHFDMTIYEFFKLLYSEYSGIFKGPYLKKIKMIIAENPYEKFKRRKKW